MKICAHCGGNAVVADREDAGAFVCLICARRTWEKTDGAREPEFTRNGANADALVSYLGSGEHFADLERAMVFQAKNGRRSRTIERASQVYAREHGRKKAKWRDYWRTWRRERIASLSPSELSEYREKEAQRARAHWASRTPDQRERYNRSRRERRASLSPADLKRRRERDAARMRKHRARKGTA